jgi:hypothetical protein
MRSSLLFLVAMSGLVSACGEADAEINGSTEFAAEEEVDSTADALLSSSAQVWLPMHEGNTWTLTSASGNTLTVSFSDVESRIGWLEGLSRSGEWTGQASSAPNTLFAWNSDLRRWDVLYRFGYAYTPWSIGAGCDKFTLKRTETDVTVVTPAGTFREARTIGYTHTPPPNARCMAPVVSSVTFAPNVGVVKLVTGTGEKFVLKSAKVNGKSIPAAPVGGITSKLVLDKTAYVNKSNTIRCITTPCPGNAENAVARFTYSITNGTSSSVTWNFNSGCQYDLTLSDSSGKVVRTLSEGRFCTLALTSITLAPGQTKTLTGQVDLALADGYTQLEGNYTAKAFLIPRSGAVATQVAPASASFSVSIVPAVP